VRLPAIAAAAARIEANSFMIDGEAVELGPDGLSRFDDLRRREAAHSAMLYAFDLVEHDGRDLRDLPFLDRKAVLAVLLRDSEVESNQRARRGGWAYRIRPCLTAWRRRICHRPQRTGLRIARVGAIWLIVIAAVAGMSVSHDHESPTSLRCLSVS
jgi:hypothetical protein